MASSDESSGLSTTNVATEEKKKLPARISHIFPKLKREDTGEKTPLSVRSRKTRIGFSDSFTSLDLDSMEIIEPECVVECSPRGVHEDDTRSSEFETPSNASTSDSESQSDVNGPRHTLFRLLKKGSPMRSFHPLKNVPKLTRRKSKRVREELIPALNTPATKPSLDPESCCFKSSWKIFSFSELVAATNDFSRENMIGQGGYAEVYKGQLEDKQYVAIKRLTKGDQEEMTADFLSELGINVHVDHPNIAKLIGYGVEGGMFLVLQLSPHGSLSSILYGSREKLDWSIRYKVALGTAEGLRYLHEGCQRRIIHRDIKAANILLSEDFQPQISDFGLSKWLPDQWTHHIVSNIEGTFGYLPPEFFMHGIVDEKTDVFAYGVLLLELITGRQALDSSQKSLVMWAKPLLSKNNTKELVDPLLNNVYDEEEMNRVVLTASMCIDPTSVLRPDMSQVIRILLGKEENLNHMMGRSKSKLQRTYSVELFDNEEYNSTKFLNDVDRHMQTLLSSCNSINEGKVEN